VTHSTRIEHQIKEQKDEDTGQNKLPHTATNFTILRAVAKSIAITAQMPVVEART